MTAEPPPGGGEIRRFIGLVLIAIGVLWMTATGLCTAGFAVSIFADSGGGSLGEAFGIYAIGRALRPRRP